MAPFVAALPARSDGALPTAREGQVNEETT